MGRRKKKAPLPQPEEIITRRRNRLESRRSIRAFFVKAILIAAIGYGLFTQVFGFAVMKGEDMYPRIRDGDLILYYRINDEYALTEVVTFTRDGNRYVGRIVARGGDTVEITREGQLLVNGNVQTEEIFYITTVDMPGSEEDGATDEAGGTPEGTTGASGATDEASEAATTGTASGTPDGAVGTSGAMDEATEAATTDDASGTPGETLDESSVTGEMGETAEAVTIDGASGTPGETPGESSATGGTEEATEVGTIDGASGTPGDTTDGTNEMSAGTGGTASGAPEEEANYTVEVPMGSVYLLCDMRTAATDSRDYGPVALTELDGKVISILRRRGI